LGTLQNISLMGMYSDPYYVLWNITIYYHGYVERKRSIAMVLNLW